MFSICQGIRVTLPVPRASLPGVCSGVPAETPVQSCMPVPDAAEEDPYKQSLTLANRTVGHASCKTVYFVAREEPRSQKVIIALGNQPDISVLTPIHTLSTIRKQSAYAYSNATLG